MAQATGSYQGGLLGNSDVVHKAGTLLLAASLAFLLPFLVDAGTRCGTSRLLRLGPSLAAFSYTLYLTHYPLLLVMRTWHEPYRAFTAFTVLVYLLKLGVCLLAAWLLYLPFERNTPKVRRFIQRLFPGNQPVAASPLPCAKS